MLYVSNIGTRTLFDQTYKVTVAKPSAITLGGGTSFIKNANSIADVSTFGSSNNKNFV